MNESSIRSDNLELVLRWPTIRAKQWTKAFLESAKEDENILAIVAIGSAVRQAVTSVDLDLVVISVDNMVPNIRPPIEIDLRTYRSNQLDALIREGADLPGWTLMFGKILFQRNDYWDNLVSSWKDRIPLPSHEIAVTRARKAIGRVREMIGAGDQNAASEMAVSYLTHLARAELLKAKQYPKSRPELSAQLREVGATRLAKLLDVAVSKGELSKRDLADVLETADLISCTATQPS